MSENAERNIKQANKGVLLQILTNLILSNDISRIKALLPAIERRFFDIRSELTDLSDLSSFISYFGYANCQNENIWNMLIKYLVRSIDAMGAENIADSITGLAHAQRGSNQLWDFILGHFKNKIEDANIDTKILVLKSLIYVGVEDQYLYETVLKKEIVAQNLIDEVILLFQPIMDQGVQDYTFENLAYIINNHKLDQEQKDGLETYLKDAWAEIPLDRRYRVKKEYEDARNMNGILQEELSSCI